MFGGMQPQIGGGQGRRFDFEGGGMGGGMQPQMAQQMVTGLEGRPLPPQFAQMPPQAFDRFSQEEMMMGGGRQASPYEAQIRAMLPAKGGGMGPVPKFANQQAYDDFMAQGGMQGMKDPRAGIGALGGMGFGRGFPGVPPIDRNTGYPVEDGLLPPLRGPDGVGDGTGPGGMGFDSGFPGGPSMTQLVNGPDPQVQRDIRPTNMQPSAIGSQMAYRPSMGAIDGRDLTRKLDITKRRQMDDLPGAIQNNLPPSLKRPTQGGMRGVRV
jgi:hypothetical protein